MTGRESLLSTDLGYMLPGMASLAGGAGEILQIVSRVQEVVGERSKCGSRWEKDRGHERKRNRGPWESGS